MTTVQEASARFTENSFKSFLDGRQNEAWVAGITRSSMPEDISKAIENLSYHSNKEGLEFLKNLPKDL